MYENNIVVLSHLGNIVIFICDKDVASALDQSTISLQNYRIEVKFKKYCFVKCSFYKLQHCQGRIQLLSKVGFYIRDTITRGVGGHAPGETN